MAVTSEEFRNALSHFPAGVTITTIRAGERIHGLTVSAFASVSAEPPLITVVIDNRHLAKEMLEEEGAVFAVNILRHDQSELSNRFAWLKDEDRFAAGTWGTALTGAPILADALAWLDCRIFARYPAGTHTVYIGEVVASGVPVPGTPPLLYWQRGYRQLKIHEPDEASDAAEVAKVAVLRDTRAKPE
ncbi:MAG TPA: flavin reductase family protein [Thermoanaerobaculia bacterium]|nr:flavin reductase family protein [Thermoanaerobaculia bacterium]